MLRPKKWDYLIPKEVTNPSWAFPPIINGALCAFPVAIISNGCSVKNASSSFTASMQGLEFTPSFWGWKKQKLSLKMEEVQMEWEIILASWTNGLGLVMLIAYHVVHVSLNELIRAFTPQAFDKFSAVLWIAANFTCEFYRSRSGILNRVNGPTRTRSTTLCDGFMK